MLGVQVERGDMASHEFREAVRRRAVQQMQEVAADRIVLGLDERRVAVVPPRSEIMPIEQHRGERSR